MNLLNVLSLIAYKWQQFIPTGNRMNGTCLELRPSTRHCARSGACDGESEQIKILPSESLLSNGEESQQSKNSTTRPGIGVTVITYCILLT